MKEFIHTFSCVTHLFESEKNSLVMAYSDNFFFNSAEKLLVLSQYAGKGLRIEIKYNPKKEKQYDKNHREYKIELIINPAKLLYPHESMKKLFSIEEYTLAFEKLEEIIREIEFISGVSIWKETKIRRIDITKDIETESDEYSKEVIRLAKLSLYKTGYKLWIPTKEDIAKTNWQESDSTMFYNHNQDINTKIYNKLTDLKNQKFDISGMSGLLRFELSLKRRYLKNNGLLENEFTSISELPKIFTIILTNAEILMQTHIASPLWNGNFLSKKLQKKYIKKFCQSKKEKMNKMIRYRDDFNKGHMDASGKVISYFEEISLSPLYTSANFNYIPSFACLLGKEEDERIKNFVEKHVIR